MNKLLLAAAVTFVVASPAVAADVLYSNNFDAENGGATALNYTGFTGLSVVDGSVDLVHTGDGFNITCPSGGCVDLDGSTNNAGILQSGSFGFDPFKLITLGFSLTGSQVGGSTTDGLVFGFNFDALTSGTFSFTSSSGAAFGGAFSGPTLTVSGSQFPSNYPLDIIAFNFRANGSGNFNFFIDGASRSAADTNNDNIGIVIDDVSLLSAAVPEPATWAMMIMGFGVIGGAMRRSARPKVNFSFA